MRNPVSLLIVLVLSLTFLSGCGQKGPLFLPGDTTSLRSIPSAEQLREAAESEEDDEDDEDDEEPTINRK